MTPSSRPDQPSALSKVADPQVFAILSITFVGVSGVQAVPPALSAVSQSLSVPDAEIGLVITAYFLPGALAIPVTGALADNLGRRRVVIGSLFLFGTAGLATLLVGEFAALLVLRALQGIGFAGTTPLSVAIVGDLYRGRIGSTVQGLRISANSVAGTVIPGVAGILAGVAWNLPFLIYGLAFPSALLVYWYLPETAGESVSPGGSSLARGRKYLKTVFGEFDDRALPLIVLGNVTLFFTRMAVLTFVPLFVVRSLDGTTFVAGATLSVLGGVGIVTAPLSGRLVGRLSYRPALLGTLALAGIASLAMPLATDLVAFLPVVVLYGTGFALSSPILNNTVAGLASDDNRAGVVSVNEIFKTAGIGVSPAVFGIVLAATDFTVLFWSIGALSLGYVALVWAIDDGTSMSGAYGASA